MKNNILEKFRSYTKKNYKSLRSSVFLSIHGKLIISKKTTNTKFKLLKNFSLKDFYKYKYRFFEMENGKIFTDNIENVSIIKDDKLLDNFSYQQIKGKLVSSKNNQVIRTGTPRFLKKLKGSIAILSQGASGYSNYAHFILDIVPKIKLLSLGTKLKNIDYFYFSKPNKYQAEIFKIIGINKNRIVDSNKLRFVQYDKVFGVTHPYYFRGTFFKSQSKIPEWIIFYLREKFMKKFSLKYKFEKIFIDRSDSNFNHCRLINNEEIKNFLKTKNFRVIKLSNFNFKEQINIFNKAKVIIGPHGAGFVNLVFCKKKTKIIEIKPVNHTNELYKKISKINGLSYKSIKLKKIKNNKKGDIFLKKEILKKYI